MFHKRSAQTEAISIVLISGIVIALVGVAYIWGVPLLQKRSASTDFSLATNFIQELDQRIVSLANLGSGKETLHIPKGALRVVPDGTNSKDNNSLTLEFAIDQPLIFGNGSTILGGAYADVGQDVGVRGESEPCVIILTSRPIQSAHAVSLTLHCRELKTTEDPPRSFKISITNPDNTTKIGENQVTLTVAKTELIPGGGNGGADLLLTEILADVG